MTRNGSWRPFSRWALRRSGFPRSDDWKTTAFHQRSSSDQSGRPRCASAWMFGRISVCDERRRARSISMPDGRRQCMSGATAAALRHRPDGDHHRRKRTRRRHLRAVKIRGSFRAGCWHEKQSASAGSAYRDLREAVSSTMVTNRRRWWRSGSGDSALSAGAEQRQFVDDRGCGQVTWTAAANGNDIATDYYADTSERVKRNSRTNDGCALSAGISEIDNGTYRLWSAPRLNATAATVEREGDADRLRALPARIR